MPRVQPRLIALVVLAPFAIACEAPSNGRAAERPSASMAAADTHAGTPKSSADSSIEATVVAVTNDVKGLRTATPAAAAAALPTHEKLVTGMLDTFESRIRSMHVTADPSWTSVIDSVRTDLTRLPAMPASSLASFLPQHLNRVMRIVACIQMVKS